MRDAIGATPKRVRAKELPVRRTTISVANRSIDSPGVFRTTDLHITRNFTELSLRRFAAIEPGGNRHDLPHELRAPLLVGAQRRVV